MTRKKWLAQFPVGNQRLFMLFSAMAFGIIGVVLLFSSRAATNTASFEAEAGTVSTAAAVTDTTASGGKGVKFKAASCTLGTDLCSKGLALAWSDEFNGTSVDTTAWSLRNNSNYGNANHEDECYESANVAETGGNLQITGKRQTVTCGGTNPNGGNSTYYFTSGFLHGTRDWKQGYYEVSMKLPKGNLYWPAFWLTGGTGAPAWPSYGEIDAMEAVGILPDMTTGTFIWACQGLSSCKTSPNNYNLSNGSPYGGSSNWGTALTSANFSTYSGVTSSRYVRYGVLWESNRITWYADGVKFRSFDGTTLTSYAANGTPTVEKVIGQGWYNTNPYTTSFATMLSTNHVLNLNLAMGGDMPTYFGYTGNETSTGYNDGNLAATLPGVMYVDYVRVYQ